MKTCGYDVLVQINEKLLNKAMAMAFYSGVLKTSGSYSFIEGIPAELQGFTNINYKVRMKNEPYIDLTGEDNIYLKLSAELYLTVLTGIEIEFDIDFKAKATIRFDISNRTLVYDLAMAQISDITVNDSVKVSNYAVSKINKIISIILTKYISEDIGTIDIPLVMYHIKLPDMPDGEEYLLPVNVSDIKIVNSRILAVGIDFFDNSSGDMSGVSDFTDDNEVFFAIKEGTLMQVFNFWWQNKEKDLKQSFSGELPVNYNEKIGKGMDIFTRVISLGFLESVSEVQNTILKYEGKVEIIDKPEVDFVEDGRLVIKKLKGRANISCFVEAIVNKQLDIDTSSFIPDKITPWEDDIKLKQYEKHKKLFNLEEEVIIDLTDAVGIVSLNKDSNLVLKLDRADFNIDLGSKRYQNITEKLLNRLLGIFENNIITHIPEFIISPSLITSSLEASGYTFNVGLNGILFEDEEIVVKMGIEVNEIVGKSGPVPLYIANRKSKKLHRYDCEAVDDIDYENRVGYYLLDEALRAGFKPCGLCLSKM